VLDQGSTGINEAKVYIDGVAQAAVSSNSPNLTDSFSNGALYLMSRDGSQHFGGGRLDDVAVYPSALGVARIQAHYEAGRPYHEAVLANSPVSYWRLGEAGGSALHDTAGSNGGTYAGSGVTNAASGGIAGDIDRAARFDGASGAAQVPDAASLDRGNGPLTIEAWVKRGATGTTQTIVDKGTDAYRLYFGGTDRLTLARSGGADIVASSSALTDTAGWHHVVATKSGATSRLYIDGADVTGTVTDATLGDTSAPLSVAGDGSGQWLSGSLDELAIYGTALTPAQVREHYAAGAG